MFIVSLVHDSLVLDSEKFFLFDLILSCHHICLHGDESQEPVATATDTASSTGNWFEASDWNWQI